MENDKFLKKVLAYGTETASPSFEEAVMKKVRLLSTKASPYQPLLPLKLERAFVFAFAAVVFLILFLCLLLSLIQAGFVTWLENLQLSLKVYRTILTFLFSFWFVFAIKTMLEKQNLFSRRRFF